MKLHNMLPDCQIPYNNCFLIATETETNFNSFLLFLFTELSNAQRLEIFPMQSEQRKPVGKPLILTCRPNVPDQALVTDLQWKDNMNNTIPPKP